MFRSVRSAAPGSSLVLVLAMAAHASAQDTVRYHWSGGLSARGIRVNAMLSGECDSVRLQVDDDPSWASPQWSGYAEADSAAGLMVSLAVQDLVPGTNYRFRFEVAGTTDTSAANIGRFRTPESGPASFSFVTGSCNSDGDHPVWQSMGWSQPLFFLSSGDLHYDDHNDTIPQPHRGSYRSFVFEKAAMMALLHRTPIAYVWDDHDFCGNASMADAAGRAAAAQVYREVVPHYPLPSDTAVYQAFTIGRIRFLLSDMRATKDSTHMMDAAQHAWLRSGLLAARDSGQIACWVTSLTWNAIDQSENWGSAPDERNELGDWLLENGIKDLFIISGDAHMLAIDDGANADFSTGQASPYRYPIFQAAALNRSGSYKGGTFNQGGPFLNPSAEYGQYGEVIVDDDGTEACITFNGWRTDSLSAAITLMNSYSFCRQPMVNAIARPIAERLHGWCADGALVIEGADPEEPLSIEVYDALGRCVQRVLITVPSGTIQLALTAARPGMHVAAVAQGGTRSMVKFLVP